MITCKDSVRFSILRLYISNILEPVASIFRSYGYPTIITCGTEAHGEDDPHTHGFAIDLRSKHIRTSEEKRKIREDLQRVCGNLYTVLLENEGKEQEHIHIQVRKDLWRNLK